MSGSPSGEPFSDFSLHLVTDSFRGNLCSLKGSFTAATPSSKSFSPEGCIKVFKYSVEIIIPATLYMGEVLCPGSCTVFIGMNLFTI